jgi:RNA polymerase sigma-70 factor (ECF subfamily)
MTRATPTDAAPREQSLLEAARGGSEEAFREIVESHRALLHAHCYRMLGSVHDADDAVQDTLLRAWRGLPRFAGDSALSSWLYRIATNACLDLIRSRRRRVLPVDYGPSSPPTVDNGQPLSESVWLEPYPDEALGLENVYAGPEARYEQREAVELAFVASLQHLPAPQRAVLILRDVLGFSAREVAESLETSVPAVNSALQRARRNVAERLPEASQQSTLRSLGDTNLRERVQAFVDAWSRADVGAIRALLAEDMVFSMPPWTSWWRGRDEIAAFSKQAVGVCRETRGLPVSANGQPAVAYYGLDPSVGRWTASSIDVFTFDGPLIREITAFVMPDAFASFGLPPALDLPPA